MRRNLPLQVLGIIGVLGGIWVVPLIAQAIEHNIVAVNVLSQLLHGQPEVTNPLLDRLSRDTNHNCQSYWLMARISPPENESVAMQYALECSSLYVDLLAIDQPANLLLAIQAVEIYPNNAAGWLWLAEIQFKNDPRRALASYQQVVRLEHSNGLAWCRLGSIYQSGSDLPLAHEAFLNCCVNEDPGKHGCLGAGRVSEEQGNLRQAIQDYRLSKFADALKRADQLEKTLQP